jgi:hypothetical protein
MTYRFRDRQVTRILRLVRGWTCAHAGHATEGGQVSVMAILAVVQLIVIIAFQSIGMPYADEIGGVVRHTRSGVSRRLRVRTKRPRAAGREILRDAEIKQSAGGKGEAVL